MAMVSLLLSSAVGADGNQRDVFSCYSDGTTGTLQLRTNGDRRNVAVIVTDSSTAGTVIGKSYVIDTGVMTLTGLISTTGLTGVSGGVAGGSTFVGTGGVAGTYVSGDANFQAQTMIIKVSGTTITVDKPLKGAIAAANINTHCVVTVEYCQ